METIAGRLIKKIKSNNGTVLTFSTVWDVYHANIGENKSSNVYKAIKKIFAKNKKIKKIWAKVGAHGRSGHSESEVLLFDVSNMTNEDFENAGITYQGNYFTR